MIHYNLKTKEIIDDQPNQTLPTPKIVVEIFAKRILKEIQKEEAINSNVIQENK